MAVMKKIQTQADNKDVRTFRCREVSPWQQLFMIMVLGGLFLGFATGAKAQDWEFVTYSHHMEEPGNLEISTNAVAGFPRGGSSFLGDAVEFEYGTKTWWTTEVYLDLQATSGQSAVFTGFRFENRIRPLLKEHWINPVLYVEYEGINGADKSLLEVVGHDGREDFLKRNDRSERKREIETRLILSSTFKGWTVAENFIAEKNLEADPWEFGYSLAVARPLGLTASSRICNLCRENFAVGMEMYGGLGTRYEFGLHDTSQYLAPLLAFKTFGGPTFKVSPTIGLNDHSHGFLLRFGVAYEFDLSRWRRN